MVIHDLDIPGRSIAPDEADAKFVVHADAPLPDSIAGEFFQPVLWRHAQSLNARRSMYHLKLSHRHCREVDKTRHARPTEQGFGVSALERLDHGQILTFRVSIVKAVTAAGSPP